MELTVIITAKNESGTVSQLVEAIGDQIEELSLKSEILLVCPDKGTARAGMKADGYRLVRWLKDRGRGKPAALNLAFSSAKGRIWLLTDGDLILEKRALGELLKGFNDQRVGLVSGRPIPQNPKSDIFGYWAHLLTEMAHQQRLEKKAQGRYLDASGYLMAFRKGVVGQIPPKSLADDTVISRIVWRKGLKIDYRPRAQALVKFPDNFKDWLAQKKRTLGGQIGGEKKEKMRSFWREVSGLPMVFSYPRGLKETWWTILLVLARLYVWILVFWERRIRNKPFDQTWVRIGSTK